MVEQIVIKCTSNGREIKANMVSKSPEILRVYVPGSEMTLSLLWKNMQYIGNKAGLEFTSTGKVVR